MPKLGPGFTKEQLQAAVAASYSYSETLRRLKLRAAGGNHKTLQKYVALWDISTEHFDPHIGRGRFGRSRRVPLEEILVEGSSYSRGHLKDRLYEAGLKQRRCELCGQGEAWRGRRMALILDHINGIANDHRLENLRILCPNCAATLETHCGRNPPIAERACLGCGRSFHPNSASQRYCSRSCGNSVPRPKRRKVARPPYEVLVAEVEQLGFTAVGRKYGVSDNAVRKWIKWYENERRARGLPA
jgi:HNH endonuclease